ncbi:MAG: glycosyltransferase family 2 protein [Prevotella sp.]|nr:glycosyltransferase family 2 protein [Prevotella sp.]
MISVCIATYQGEKYIHEQLASILCQLADGDEIIVSDDGSTDRTLNIIRQMADHRIKIVEGPHRHSPTLNFERALQEARGEYIFLADQDDVWKPDKVQVCMQWLKHYSCVVSDAEVTDHQLRLLHPSLYALMGVRPGRLYNTVWKNGYTGCCMAFRRNVLEASLPFPQDIPMHDIWIGNVAAYQFNIKFIPDKLIAFRRHEQSTSCNGKGSKYTIWQRVKFRWSVMKHLVNLFTFSQNQPGNNR